jgi:hypothetical protein
MLRTYKATLTNGQVQWEGEAPDTGQPLRVIITVVEPTTLGREESDGPAMAAALQKLADMGGLSSAIPDPSAWQREIRKDRPLAGRDE